VHYYGAAAIKYAVHIHTTHAPWHEGKQTPMAVNLDRLGLSQRLLEESGLDLGKQRHVDYLDSSTNPPTPRRFRDTAETRPQVSPLLNHASDVDLERTQSKTAPGLVAPSPVAPSPAVPSPADPNHHDHAMLQQIRAGVCALDQNHGKPYDDSSERISRCLLAACKDNRDMRPETGGVPLSSKALQRVDHVLLGTTGNIFAVEGELHDPAHKRVCVPLQQALQTPVEQSDQKLQAANQCMAQEQRSARHQALTCSADDPSRGVPAMTR